MADSSLDGLPDPVTTAVLIALIDNRAVDDHLIPYGPWRPICRWVRDQPVATRLDALNDRLRTEDFPEARINEITEAIFKLDPDSANDLLIRERRIWGLDDILALESREVPWVVEGLVVDEGLTVLGGKKKVGKSLLCLQIAHAVAGGRSVLDRPTTQGAVVYLCLEDGTLRLQRRLVRQGATAHLPVRFITTWKPLDQGGFDDLHQLIAEINPRLVIIDTLASATSANLDENVNAPVAELANRLRRLGQDLGVGLLVAAHHGKTNYGDVGFDLRGASALSAASDVNLGLYSEGGAHELRAEGRDIEGLELRVSLDEPTLCWHPVGDARVLAREEAEADVRDALADLGEADAQEMADNRNKSRSSIQDAAKRMADQGRLNRREVPTGKKSKKLVYSLPGDGVEKPPNDQAA